MKKKVISILLVSALLVGCGSTKSTTENNTQTEISGEHVLHLSQFVYYFQLLILLNHIQPITH